MADKAPTQQAKKYRVLDALLVVAVLFLSTYAFLISGGWELLDSRSHTQPVATDREDCPPCEAAKREKEQAALIDQAETIEDTAETKNSDSGG